MSNPRPPEDGPTWVCRNESRSKALTRCTENHPHDGDACGFRPAPASTPVPRDAAEDFGEPSTGPYVLQQAHGPVLGWAGICHRCWEYVTDSDRRLIDNTAPPAPSAVPSVEERGGECCHGITLARITERCAECGLVGAEGPAPLVPLDLTDLPEWAELVRAVEKAGGRMGARWMLPIGDRAIALVGASRRLAADLGSPS